MGIPCSHLLSIGLENKDFPIEETIRKRWIKELFESNLSIIKLMDDIKDFLLRTDKDEEKKEEQKAEEEGQKEDKNDIRYYENEEQIIQNKDVNGKFVNFF